LELYCESILRLIKHIHLTSELGELLIARFGLLDQKYVVLPFIAESKADRTVNLVHGIQTLV
jgi:hypothetical protein